MFLYFCLYIYIYMYIGFSGQALQSLLHFQRALPREGKLPDWGGALLPATIEAALLVFGRRSIFRDPPSQPGIGTDDGIAKRLAVSSLRLNWASKSHLHR